MRDFIGQGRIKGLLIDVEGPGEGEKTIDNSNEDLLKESHTGTSMVKFSFLKGDTGNIVENKPQGDQIRSRNSCILVWMAITNYHRLTGL